jgi:hypothetical protein
MDSGCEFLNRGWCDRLNSYMGHRNDEHLEALVHEARDFFSVRIDRHLPCDSVWHSCDETLRTGALLYMLDKTIVQRCLCNRLGVSYKPAEVAELMVLSRPELLPFAMPLLELLACIRRERALIADPNCDNDC